MSVTFEPALYYDVTAQDDNPDCANYFETSGKTFEVNPFFSNDGVHCYVTCGLCRQHMEILTATLLDPQPPAD